MQDLDVTALIDIVIILISFFIFFNNAADAETNERLKLPKSEIARPNDILPEEPLTIQVLNNGTILFNLSEYTAEKFATALSVECRIFKDRKIPLEKITVMIRGDARCETGKVMDVVKECQGRGLSTFRFIALADKNR